MKIGSDQEKSKRIKEAMVFFKEKMLTVKLK